MDCLKQVNFEVQDSEFTTGSDIGFNANEAQADRFNTGTITWTAYDSTANSLPTLSTFRNYSDDSDVVPIVPSGNRTVGQYGNTVEYQDDNSCIVNVQQPAVTAHSTTRNILRSKKLLYIRSSSWL